MQKKLIILGIFCISIVLIYIINRNKNLGISESCSPVNDEIYCTRFKCITGNPEPTLGGAGACSDHSRPVLIESYKK